MKPFARNVLVVALVVPALRSYAQGVRTPGVVQIDSPPAAPFPNNTPIRSGPCSTRGGAVGCQPRSNAFPVGASVSDRAVTQAVVTVNGTSEVIAVDQGQVFAEVDWVEGNNRVTVAVRSAGRVVRDSVTWFRSAPVPALRVRAAWSWPGDQPVVRLLTPSGGRCEEAGDAHGVWLNCDAPEAGRYRVVVVRPRAAAARATPFTLDRIDDGLLALASVDEELVGAVGRQRALLLAARREALDLLDADASPTATAGGATFAVTLYAGTSDEQRWTFRASAPAAGEREVGSFLVTPAMLARGGTP